MKIVLLLFCILIGISKISTATSGEPMRKKHWNKQTTGQGFWKCPYCTNYYASSESCLKHTNACHVCPEPDCKDIFIDKKTHYARKHAGSRPSADNYGNSTKVGGAMFPIFQMKDLPLLDRSFPCLKCQSPIQQESFYTIDKHLKISPHCLAHYKEHAREKIPMNVPLNGQDIRRFEEDVSSSTEKTHAVASAGGGTSGASLDGAILDKDTLIAIDSLLSLFNTATTAKAIKNRDYVEDGYADKYQASAGDGGSGWERRDFLTSCCKPTTHRESLSKKRPLGRDIGQHDGGGSGGAAGTQAPMRICLSCYTNVDVDDEIESLDFHLLTPDEAHMCQSKNHSKRGKLKT